MQKRITTIIYGTGAEENSWLPIIKAIQAFRPECINSNMANMTMARMVYVLRWLKNEQGKTDKEKYKSKEVFSQLYAEFIDIRKKIANELIESERCGEIVMNTPLIQIIEDYVIGHADAFYLCTTNWDKCTENTLKKEFSKTFDIKQCKYIHGNYDNPDKLYLPSEVAFEPYRDEDISIEIQREHKEVSIIIEESNRTIIYGLSMSALDSELSQTIVTGLTGSNKTNDIIIVDPYYKQVFERLMAIVDLKEKVKIFGICPTNMNKIQLK